MLTGWGLPTVRVGQVVVNRQPGGIDKADASQVTRCSAVQATTTTIQRGAWQPLQTTCHDAGHWNSPLSCATLWSRRIHATVSGRIGRETAVDRGLRTNRRCLPLQVCLGSSLLPVKDGSACDSPATRTVQ